MCDKLELILIWRGENKDSFSSFPGGDSTSSDKPIIIYIWTCCRVFMHTYEWNLTMTISCALLYVTRRPVIILPLFCLCKNTRQPRIVRLQDTTAYRQTVHRD